MLPDEGEALDEGEWQRLMDAEGLVGQGMEGLSAE